MSSHEARVEKILTREELAGFLQEVVDGLVQGSMSTSEGTVLDLSHFKKIKVSVKDEFGQVFVKLKVKTRGGRTQEGGVPEMAEAGMAMPTYKDLKKRMKKSFKVIFSMVHDDKIPPREAVDSFLADSRLMISYPGYGDEYYEEYDRACKDFATAYEKQDLDLLHTTCDQLDMLKSHCHNKYK